MTAVYNSTIQGLVEKNVQGLQRLLSFGSQGPLIIRQLYLQISGYSQG